MLALPWQIETNYFSDFAGEKDGDMSVMSMPQRNGEMKDAQTQTDDELLLMHPIHKATVS